MYAYPIMEQIRNAIDAYEKAQSRALDLFDLKGHLKQVVEEMRLAIHDFPRGQTEHDELDAQFIFAGFSWAKQQYKIWRIDYNVKLKKFTFEKTSTLFNNEIAIIGDNVIEAEQAILAKMEGKQEGTGFIWEPFEVLRDFCRDENKPHIGGSPQIVKIYKHLNTMPYVIFWPSKQSRKRTLFGRPLKDFENPRFMTFDPDTLLLEDFIPSRRNPTGSFRLYLARK